MKKISLFLFLAINLFASQLTQKSVESFLKNIEKTAQNKNFKKLGDSLDEKADITVNINLNGLKQVVKLNKSRYVSFTKKGLGNQKFDFEVLKTEIKIKNKIAYVYNRIKQRTFLGQNAIVGITDSNSQIKLVNNKLKVTKIDSFTKIDLRDQNF